MRKIFSRHTWGVGWLDFPQKFNLLGTCGNLAEPSNPSIRISSNDKKNHPTRFFFGVSDLLLTCFSMENLYVMSFHVEVSTCRGLCPRRSSPAYGAATAVICPIQTSRMLLAFQGSFLDSKRWRHDWAPAIKNCLIMRWWTQCIAFGRSYTTSARRDIAIDMFVIISLNRFHVMREWGQEAERPRWYWWPPSSPNCWSPTSFWSLSSPLSHEVQPIPPGVTFSKAQSSKLERLFRF